MSGMKKYVLGTASIAALAVVFATVAGTPLSTTMVQTDNDQFGPSAHVTMVIRDSDGNVKYYAQSDNLVPNEGESNYADELFVTGTTSVFNCAALGEDSLALDELTTAADFAGVELTATGRVCTPAAVVTPGVLVGADANVHLDRAFVIDAADDGKDVGFVALFDDSTGGRVLSITPFSGGSFTANTGDNVDLDVDLTVT